MPVYKFACGECDLEFDRLISREESKGPISCINCGSDAKKIIGNVNFNFSSTRKQGETGVHDIDYPVIDKAVGRSSEKRWGNFEERRSAEDSARSNLDTAYLGKVPIGAHTDGYYKVSEERLDVRREAAKDLDQALSGS